MVLLSVDRVTKRFGNLVAVNEVSFELHKGEILGLIGPNGAGKTTLFNVIAGRYKPDGGRILFDSTRIDGKRPDEICRLGLARTFQEVKPFLNESIYENTLQGVIYGANPDHDITASVAKALAIVDMKMLGNARVSELPFIERRKVELARTIATGARLVLLDEPMAGLNPSEVKQFSDVIRKLNFAGVSVLIIEHVMKAVMNLCSRIVVLNYGVKIAEGTPDEISKNVHVIQSYLGQ